MLQNLLFMEKENPRSFFVFHLEQLSFPPYECPGLCQHRPGDSYGKTQKCSKWKTEKATWVFFFYKYGKFCSVLPNKKVVLKPLFSEECTTYYFFFMKSNYFFLLSAGKNPFEIQFFSKVVAQFLPIFRALYGVDVDVVAVRSVVLTVVFSKPFSIWLLNSKFSKKYVVIHCTYINIVAHNI